MALSLGKFTCPFCGKSARVNTVPDVCPKCRKRILPEIKNFTSEEIHERAAMYDQIFGGE